MNLRVAIVIAAAITLAGCSSHNRSTDTSCVSPRLSVSPTVSPAGGRIQVKGEWFLATCNDVQTAGVSSLPSSSPLGRITLAVTGPDGVMRPLASLRPNPSGSFTTDLKLPQDLPSGRATLFVEGHGLPVTLTLTGS